eukprot:6212980-Pleurochrysis_carterae.AAC.2
MHVRKLLQLREACEARIGRVAEAIHQRANQHLHGLARVQRSGVRLHVVQKIRADQLAEISHRLQIRLAGLRTECWP